VIDTPTVFINEMTLTSARLEDRRRAGQQADRPF
jgi:hypothetical protein